MYGYGRAVSQERWFARVYMGEDTDGLFMKHSPFSNLSNGSIVAHLKTRRKVFAVLS